MTLQLEVHNALETLAPGAVAVFTRRLMLLDVEESAHVVVGVVWLDVVCRQFSVPDVVGALVAHAQKRVHYRLPNLCDGDH